MSGQQHQSVSQRQPPIPNPNATSPPSSSRNSNSISIASSEHQPLNSKLRTAAQWSARFRRRLQPKLAIELGVSARLGNVPTKQVVGPPQLDGPATSEPGAAAQTDADAAAEVLRLLGQQQQQQK
ncbi:uncharacterized protein LOC108086510 [Drosophila ficusphila]|uniref:uncharacterized protein LOC108086510 n=1 Tax=Drosophila ficusphila TaxID=30025 RepID=UPI0007E621CD|nr:uncharacterized protein LOC108086510 [Drosophila ficusphila]